MEKESHSYSSKREPATTLSEGPVGAFRGSEVNHPANMKTYSQIFQECGRHVRKPFGMGGGRWARPKMFGTRLERVRNTLIQESARPQSVASRPSPDPITGLHGQQPRSHHFAEVHWRLPLTQWGTTETLSKTIGECLGNVRNMCGEFWEKKECLGSARSPPGRDPYTS